MSDVQSTGSTAGASKASTPPTASNPAPTDTGRTGREIVDAHTTGTTTDAKAVAQDLKQEIKQRPTEATQLMKDALAQAKVDDRDEIAQEFIRAHSDDELKTLGQTDAGVGALALGVNEMAQGSVYNDEVADAQRVGAALGKQVNIEANAGWGRFSGYVHGALDVAGFVPALGAIPDLINAGIYAAEGDKANAALSVVAAVPLAGDTVKGGVMAVKGVKQALKHGDDVLDVGKAVVKNGDEVVEGGAKVLKGGDDLAQGLPKTAGVTVTGSRAIDKAQTYEEGVRKLYGSVPFKQRQYEAIVDGKLVSGVADNVAVVAGKNTAIEAKFVDDWATSIRNPASPAGARPWAKAEQANMVEQAKKYSAAFDQVIFHTNSPELAAQYTKMFQDAGVANFKFVITPAIK